MTVREVSQSLLPDGTRLVGGDAGLDREVTWAATLRPRPPAFGGLKGGELALVSIRSMRQLDESLTLAFTLDRLARLNVAAIVAREAGEAPIDEAAATADLLGIPLFLIPDHASLSEIEQRVTRLIADRRAAVYERSQRIHSELMDLALRGEGLRRIIERMAHVTSRAVVLEDRNHELWVAAGSLDRERLGEQLARCGPALDSWIDGQRLSAADPPSMTQALDGGLSRWVAPVIEDGRAAGYLSVIGSSTRIGEAERLAVRAGAAACAIDFARQRAIQAAEDRTQGDVVDDLLTHNYPDEAAIIARTRRIGLDLEEPIAVLVISAVGQDGTAGARLAGAVARVTNRRLETLPWRYREGAVAVLIPSGTHLEDVSRRTRQIVDELQTDLDLRLSAGLGQAYHGSEGVRRAFREARQALDLGQRLFGPGQVTAYADLGLYRLLLELHGSPELQRFHDEQLRALVEYDEKHGARLVETLDAFFRANHSPTEAAARLHLHRNTLIYRLQRIRDVSGADLDDPEVRLKLHLALRIRETLSASYDRLHSST